MITTNIDWFEQTASPIVVGNRLCDVLGFPDQSVPPKYEWVNLSETDDVETEYDNIDIALDYKTYRSNSIIRIHISNKNNKPYGFYPVPYVEKYDYNTNTWERLIYAPDEAYYAVGWYTGVGDVTLYFNPFYMAQPIEIGEYRFIVFVGEGVLFTILHYCEATRKEIKNEKKNCTFTDSFINHFNDHAIVDFSYPCS